MNRLYSLTVLMSVVLIFTTAVAAVTAQYGHEPIHVNIGYDGVFSSIDEHNGIEFKIVGRWFATGSIFSEFYGGNPQPMASIPKDVWLTRFVIISIKMADSDFDNATISIPYTDKDFANLRTPYAIYKYEANSNSYVEVPSTVYAAGKTITVAVTSTDDLLFGIGGKPIADPIEGYSMSSWAILVVSAIVIVLLVVGSVTYLKRH